MVDQMAIDLAVDAELTRVVRAAENGQTYRGDTLRVYGYKIMREAFPDKINRDSWRAMSNRVPDTSADPTDPDVIRAERERQERQERRTQRQADRDLLQEHGRAICCPDCDRQNAARLREELARQGTVQPPLPEMEEEEPEEPECLHGTVMCRECNGTGCGGLDRWGDPNDCDTSCPACDRCEESHPCSQCDLDPQCDHAWRCQDCGEDVEWDRDHWVVT